MNRPQERELVRQCIRHNRAAWETFVDTYSDYLYSVILQGLKTGRFPHAREDAEDILAEVFLSLVEKNFHLLRSFEWRCGLKTWLWVVARKKVFRHFRKKGIRTVSTSALDEDEEDAGRMSVPVAEEPNPLESAGSMEMRSVVEETLTELGDRDRLSLALYYYEGLPYRRIAQVMNIPVNQVGIQIFRAKKRLEKKLEGRGIKDL